MNNEDHSESSFSSNELTNPLLQPRHNEYSESQKPEDTFNENFSDSDEESIVTLSN